MTAYVDNYPDHRPDCAVREGDGSLCDCRDAVVSQTGGMNLREAILIVETTVVAREIMRRGKPSTVTMSERALQRVLEAARDWEFHQQVDPECETERR